LVLKPEVSLRELAGFAACGKEPVAVDEAAQQVTDQGGLAGLLLGGEQRLAIGRPQPLDALADLEVRFGQQIGQ
jgi:hypothetical protein